MLPSMHLWPDNQQMPFDTTILKPVVDETARTSSACLRLKRASNSSALGNLLGSRKRSSAHSSFMLFCSGVPVTSSLFLKLHVDSSWRAAARVIVSAPAREANSPKILSQKPLAALHLSDLATLTSALSNSCMRGPACSQERSFSSLIRAL